MSQQNKERFGYDYDSRNAPEELGKGASGRTYKGWIRAREDLSGEGAKIEVALKHFNYVPTDTTTVRVHEAEREFSYFGALQHRHVVKYLRFFYHNRRPIIATRFIRGSNLHKLATEACKSGANLAPDWVLRVVRWGHQIAGALVYLADCNIVHRDIKPSNIMIQEEDESGKEDDSAILIDFGISKLNVQRRTLLTSMYGRDSFLGTPQFAAPEQFIDDRDAQSVAAAADITGAADVYSLGVTLAYALNIASVPEDKGDSTKPADRLPHFDQLPEHSSLITLLKKMTLEAPQARPSIQTVKAALESILDRDFDESPEAGDTGVVPPPYAANDLPVFVPVGNGVEIARSLLTQHTALCYAERRFDSLELDASSAVARRNYKGTLEFINTINRELSDYGYHYRLPTSEEWKMAAGYANAGMLTAYNDETVFDSESKEMEWLDSKAPCVFPECRKVAFLAIGGPEEVERHQSWPKGAIRLARVNSIVE